MISFAITGGIGSGKSYVSRLLEERGIPFYYADDEAKRLMLTDEHIRQDLVDLLGEEVYRGDTLNKPLLAAYLFAAPENAARINAIVHPRVKEDFCRWLLARQEMEFAGFESAILFEANFADTVDRVVMVYAPEALRMERAMKRDKATGQQVRARMDAQMKDEEKCLKSDFIIYNDGTRPLEPQLDELLDFLKRRK